MFLQEHVEIQCHAKRRAIKDSPLCENVYPAKYLGDPSESSRKHGEHTFCPIKPISNMFNPTMCT